MKQLVPVLIALTVSCGCASTHNTSTVEQEASNTVLSKEDRHALEVGRKVMRIKSAFQTPERQAAIDAVRELGLDSRHYVMVRGWILQHISMTESYKGTTAYMESGQRKNEIDGRIAALRRMLRAIDLE